MASCGGAACDFERDYEIAQAPLMRELEARVRGSDYGATSWTTREQADGTAARLALGPGTRLLDIGSGAGWPGLLLAKLAGCDVTLTDLPLSGLRAARLRADADGLAGRCGVFAADGTALPFADASFDAIHHADVLCCMDRKREMLHECRRVARAGARMEFSVIWLVREPADDDERALLSQSGPAYPDAGADYAALLERAGWAVRRRIDVTAQFARCIHVLIEEYEGRRDALLELLGGSDYADRLARRRSTSAAVARGLLEREIIVSGTRP